MDSKSDINIIYRDELTNQQKKKALNILRKNAHNIAGLPEENNGPFSFIIEDQNKIVQAFIEGYCYYGCCYIDLLAVEEGMRNQDYGSKLIKQAEELAKNRGCLFMAVNTMDFEAKPFYEKHGFKVEFTREGFAKQKLMHFLKKNI